MATRKVSQEQRFISDLEDRLRDSRLYSSFRRNVVYSSGEIDLVAHLVAGGFDLFEVKSTPSSRSFAKAKLQLSHSTVYGPYKHVQDTYVYIGKTQELVHYRRFV